MTGTITRVTASPTSGSKTDAPLSVLWHWYTMGPYHFARMRALQSRPHVNLICAETSSLDDHGWCRGTEAQGLNIISSRRSTSEFNGSASGDYQVLWELQPSIVVAPGYADPHFLAAVARYKKERPDTVAVLWSESTADDHKRRVVTEAVKAQCLSLFDGALVAGNPHASYLTKLGMQADRISVVGNCVDNLWFSSRVCAARSADAPVPKYFLFVGRLIPEKNLAGLLEAYVGYRSCAKTTAWPLVLVGGGPLEKVLKQEVVRRGIDGVIFAGPRQVDQLPHYYAHAGCFILPSVSEPWGLVVNEAMASGLPVLVSRRCGSSTDLVSEGVNGFTFDPENTERLTSLMERVSSAPFPRGQFGAESERIVASFTPEIFAEKADVHFRRLMARQRVKSGLKDTLIQTGAAVWSKLG